MDNTKYEKVFHTLDIDKMTLENDYYRKVIYSKPDSQLTLQTLMPGEDIPFEMHKYTKQSFKFVEGEGEVVILNSILDHGRRTYKVRKDSYVIVPSGVYHYIRNTSKVLPLRLYADYSSPVHSPSEIEKRQGNVYQIGSKSCSGVSSYDGSGSGSSEDEYYFEEKGVIPCRNVSGSINGKASSGESVGGEGEGDQGSLLFAIRYNDDEWAIVDQEGSINCEHRFKDMSGFLEGKCPLCE